VETEETHTRAADRLQLFVDAVIAIAITLLALELPLPNGISNSELVRAIWAERGEYLAFMISFAVIFAHWSAHHRVFRHVVRTDAMLVRLTGLWLFLQVITPFVTKVLGGEFAFQARFGLYALVQAAAGLLFLLMVSHVRRARLTPPGTDPSAVRRTTGIVLALVVGFVVSIPVAFVTSFAYALWAVVPLGYALLRRLLGR
jgi:uncharacterized membrane protein